MERFKVAGGARLAGEIAVCGAKNSALKLMAVALLAEGRTELRGVPRILDVELMAELLRRLGCDVRLDWEPGPEREDGPQKGSAIVIDVPAVPRTEADYDLVRRLRASICVLGPLLARQGEAKVSYPGGDAIGSRGLDMHIDGLERLGADISQEHGFLVATAKDGLTGASILLDFPSVGATENILMAAVLARGTTVIDNAAREPEIVDICSLLASMGAKIDGAGSSTLVIEGVDTLSPAPSPHQVVADRIVAGMFAVAATMTRGDVRVDGGNAAHLEIALDKLTQAGAIVVPDETGFRVSMDRRPKSVDIITLPYPGFATDLQPLFAAMNSIAEGTSMVTENLFDARFVFLQELARLGASVRTEGHHAIVRGVEKLSGAPVRATDIRAGAGLVLAGLVADGHTTVSDVRHIDRGYQGLVTQLRSLGAQIEREPDPDPYP
ncbi:UDP-N-acetylglucosamine 1-carboxyvinyltransferase [Catenulispora pinisilvae]|uniref:UDP-N-acetylglucosamine 1-carboxyvinyltransferase n=1 Tax=Catenulispora pinisilvae TaxID=2705253 RepID=UPI00189186C3|nr:UDP-N-acetylglucosamine 1-carboxyvinyltransferase [Catenulispora pinisilvae]